MAVTLTAEQSQALEILRACGEAERIAIAQALLPPGLEVMRRPSEEEMERLKAGLSDGSVDWRDPEAIRRALETKHSA